ALCVRAVELPQSCHDLLCHHIFELESKTCILSHAQLENGLSVLVDDKLNSLRLEDGLKLFQPCYGIGAAQLHHMGGPFLQLDLQLRWIEIAEFADEDNAL